MACTKIRKLLLGALISVPVWTTGCTTTATEPELPPLKPGKSVISNYLVGQYAVRHRQMQDAADFLGAVERETDLPGSLQQNIDRQLFTILAGEGQLTKALEVADSFGDDHLMATVVQAVEDVAQGNIQKAHDGIDKISSSGLGAYIKPLIHAWLIAGTKSVDEALESLNGFRQQKGLEALYHLHAALLNEFGGRKEEAERQYKAASKTANGLSLRLAELYATFLVKQNRKDEARAVYNSYFVSHPDSLYIQAMLDEMQNGALEKRPAVSIKDGIAETLFGLGSSLRSQSTRQTGLIMGRMALHVKPDFPIAQILIAEILESDQRFEDANRVYGSVAKSNPYSWSARLRLALNLDDLGQTDEAVAILEEMVAERPERMEGLVTLGDVLRHRQFFDKAQDAYGRAIKLLGDEVGPHHWNLFYSRAIALERLKRWDDAEPLFLKALELEPKQPFVLNYLGYSWIEIGRNLEKAQKMIEEAVAQRPRDGYIVDSLGWVLYRLGDFEKAVPHLERAVELQPSDPIINDHLGDAYWKVGRTREARFQWLRAKSLEPETDVLEKIQDKLANGLVEE